MTGGTGSPEAGVSAGYATERVRSVRRRTEPVVAVWRASPSWDAALDARVDLLSQGFGPGELIQARRLGERITETATRIPRFGPYRIRTPVRFDVTP